MKKLFTLLLIISMISFVVAQEAPYMGVNDSEVEQIQEAVDDYAPFDEEGNVNVSKYAPYKSKAEERIEGVNQWIKDNASWLGIVFGMVPEISWLFAINIYVLLFFLVSIVFNSNSLWVFLSEGKAKLFGLGVFIVLLVTKFFTNVLARPVYAFWLLVFDYGWIAIIAFCIVLIILMIFFPRILRKISTSVRMRRRKAAREEEAFNQKVLKKTVEGITNN